MCDNCEIVKAAFEGAKSQPHLNYTPLHAMLSEMLKQRRLELYAGDCTFDEIPEVLDKETHFTVCSYLRQHRTISGLRLCRLLACIF